MFTYTEYWENMEKAICLMITILLWTTDTDAACTKFSEHDNFKKAVEVSGTCFYAFQNPLQYSNAEALCLSEGMMLPNFQDGTKQNDVWTALGSEYNEHWIGLKKVDGSWKWWDVTTGTGTDMTSDRWQTNPSGVCARTFTSNMGPKWVAQSLNSWYRVVCEDSTGSATTRDSTSTESTTSLTTTTDSTTTDSTSTESTTSWTTTTVSTTKDSTSTESTTSWTTTTVSTTTDSTSTESTTSWTTTTVSTTKDSTSTESTTSWTATTDSTTTDSTTSLTSPADSPGSSTSACRQTSYADGTLTVNYRKNGALGSVEVIAQLSVHSQLDCARRCLSETTCCYFTFNSDTYMCRHFRFSGAGNDITCTSQEYCFINY